MGSIKKKQILDYENFPFWCICCHKYGHIQKHCDMPFVSKLWRVKGPKVSLSMNKKISPCEDLLVRIIILPCPIWSIMSKSGVCLNMESFQYIFSH